MPADASVFKPALHFHVTEEVCPLCEQPIPHDQFEQIKGRIEARERQLSVDLAAELEQRLAAEREAILEGARKEAAAKEADIRAEAEQSAQETIQKKLIEADRARKESEATLQSQIAKTEAAKISAEEASSAAHAEFAKAQSEHKAALDRMKEDAVFREGEIRREAEASAGVAVKGRIETLEQARAEAEAKAATAEQQAQTLQEAHETQLVERLREQREALETEKSTAVNAEKSAHFHETLKLSNQVGALQRALEKKTADELGEGAEVNLLEALKAEFEGDRINRVGRGLPGADIIHAIIHNGKECGKIIYDSKNHSAWRNDFVVKLAADQMAEKAEHAILATRKFPAGTGQLHVQNGVMIANPARIVALVQIVRHHLIQTHTLRMSGERRTQKTEALYDFITSERSNDLFGRIETQTEDLLALQDQERRAHESTWKRQGLLIRSVQKVSAELTHEIDAIIGAAEASDQ